MAKKSKKVAEAYSPWTRNELNINSKGGSEVMVETLLTKVDPTLLENFQIVPSRVRELREDKIRIFWSHDLAHDPESQFLKDETERNKFMKLIFCGNWQFQQYQNFLGVPHDNRTVVLETAIEPLELRPKGKGEIRLIYASTPQRGLELLIPAFEELCKKYSNITLDVFSSFEIYGWKEADANYQELFNRCIAHPKINYHGFQPNDVVRKAIEDAHIFAYPSIWQECNSKALIEAMSGGCLCVHPNYAGLPDTAGGMTMMYNWNRDSNVHVNIAYQAIDHAIQKVMNEDLTNYLKFQKSYADFRYSWTKMSAMWTNMLQGLVEEYRGQDLGFPKKMFSFKTS